MSADLVKTNLERSLAVTSLDDLVRAKTSTEAILLLDVSGSMRWPMRNGKMKIDGLRQAVKEITSEHSDVKMVAFGGDGDGAIRFVNAVPDPNGSTPLTQAIDFCKDNKAGHLVVVSDGMPDNPNSALEAAARFGGRIDIIFVGNPGEAGEDFLRRLAEATGGTSFTGDLSKPKELGKGIAGLLTGAADDEDDDE